MSYEHLTVAVMREFRAGRLEHTRPQLAIVSNETTTNQGNENMKPSTDEQPQAAAIPLHRHGAFNEMEGAIRLLSLGADALKGIGVMMRPETAAGDEQLNQARRSEISAIFEFFGEVLREPAEIAGDSAWRLEQAAKGNDI